ncbi:MULTISPECIES: aminodeoxychorismate synthase component I [Pseudofrankia]|uniref:aminodeoxychorismate synthase component I n=1 Tax=Pseudofrankia TaxID=2994363 RepID=UPI000234B4B3|nr:MULTISPECIES: aminodeoxychorismate synthase component I [Pseudofrankia]OHV36642.1 aminodeoxychorismate synthase, component I [Pseudofrankia sp. EUN1h]
MAPVYARFDDLSAGVAWEFPRTAFTLEAARPGDVTGLLADVEAAAADGWWAYGFVAYEAAAGLDPALAVDAPVPGLPLAWFGVSPPPRLVPPVRASDLGAYRVGEWAAAWDEDEHTARVEAVRREIAAGETYQCNLTTRLTAETEGDERSLYADLALGQRGSYNAYLDLGRFAVASASPELFFETSGRAVRMRPMKGTARRGETPAQDAAIVAALRASEKERAENIMIVDLVRNDLARVATTGSVRVTSLCRAERYETVHQLTSGVAAALRPEAGLVDVFRALFPCGSVTGAPKARTMELIRELEDGPRGVYCGAIGMVAPPGAASFEARFSVPIRTALVDRAAGLATYGAGGGITWSSVPAAEYAELRAKAEILTRLARPAVRR